MMDCTMALPDSITRSAHPRRAAMAMTELMIPGKWLPSGFGAVSAGVTQQRQGQ